VDGGEKSDLICAWALEEGFDRAGVAVLDRSEHEEAFERWLERGEHGEMSYLEKRRDVRLDPRLILDGARSAVCVALHYHPLRDSVESEGDLWPRVARYARGSDYHGVMERRLEALAERICAAFPGTGTRLYVDTGPVLERELAARAGIGVAGKNTNLLHPESGSWFLLGELFTTLELRPDPPISDLCGSCTRCLEECPTGAFPEPYRLDSNRCISYWTIEHRGPIPSHVRSSIGDWVFGCDVCQEVCPVNPGRDLWPEGEFHLPKRRADLDLASLLSLERERYVEIFRGTAMKRAKLEGLKRNAAVAMGNRGDKRYLPALSQALCDADPTVRGHAAWALGRIGNEAAVEVLESALGDEEHPVTRGEITASLQVLRDVGGQKQNQAQADLPTRVD